MNWSQDEQAMNSSIKLRNQYKALIDYYEMLKNTFTSFPHEDVDIFDDIFRSFVKEPNYDVSFRVLQLLFAKNAVYSWDKVKRKISFNIGRTLDHFLTKFKTNVTTDDRRSLHPVITALDEGEALELRNLKDTDYVIGLMYLKHYKPALYNREKDEILRRIHDNDSIDECVKSFARYSNQLMNDLIYFECHSFVLIRNTNIITENYIDETVNILSDGRYRGHWITIFANKMLATLIVPIIAFKQTHAEEIPIDDQVLVEWLLAFSQRALGRKVAGCEDKLESINDEEFALTWTYVQMHGTPEQRTNFQNYLIQNGFEFHANDPFSK